MNRIVTTLATGVVLGAVLTASPATAEAKKGPALGAWTCADSAAAPFATFELFKGNKYAANGETEKSKYVYKAGQHKLKFKNGVWADTFYGTYDKETKTVTLVNSADDTAAATCTRDEVPVTPAP